MKKKVIFSAAASLVMCASIITGSTFALFTHETTANIAITSAKVELTASIVQDSVQTKQLNGEWMNGSENTLAKGVTVGTDNVNLNNIAPGDAIKFNIAIKNESTIDVKYCVKIDVDDDGLFNGLTMKIDNELVTSSTVEDWKLLTVGSDLAEVPVEIELENKEGNDAYQGKNCKISYTVEACQSNAVNQVSIGNTTYESLSDAMENTQVGEVITLASGTYEFSAGESVGSNGSIEIQEGADVTLVLDGATIATNTSSDINTPTVVNNGNLTIQGGTITNNNPTAGNTNVPAVSNESGTLTLENCVIKNTAPTSGGAYSVTVSGGEVILNNCTVVGNRGGIAVSGEGSIKMVGGSVAATVYYPLYLRGTGASSFEGVTFTKENSSKGKAITYNDLAEGGSVTFKDCTFVSKTSATISFDISNNTTGVTFAGACTFTKVTDPNA